MGELRRAMENGELVLNYQPQMYVRGDRIPQRRGARALAASRAWAASPPDEFVPLAERTGLIRPLTLRVVELAVQQWASWRAEGRNLRMAANLSARNLHDPELADDISRLIWKYKCRPDSSSSRSPRAP